MKVKRILLTFFLLFALFFALVISFIFDLKIERPINKSTAMNSYLLPRLLLEIDDFNGRLGIALYDVNEKKSLLINADEIFPAASLIKVPVMLGIFDQVQAKKFSLKKKITYRSNDRAGGYGLMQTYPLGTRFSIAKLLTWMIQISDNDATRALVRTLGPETINTFVLSQGFPNSQLRSFQKYKKKGKRRKNLTTPAEIMGMLNLIFDESVYDQANARKMINILQTQKLNDNMPRYLPKNTLIGHKTGLLTGVVHDVGIFSLSKNKYILCILSEGEMTLQKQRGTLGKISRIIYNYFEYNKGPYLLSNKKAEKSKIGILLLAGSSYLPANMKNMAEYFNNQDVAVYCLPFTEGASGSIDNMIALRKKEIAGGLALLKKYSLAQYVVASVSDSFYLFDQELGTKTNGLVVIPEKNAGKYLLGGKLLSYLKVLKRSFLFKRVKPGVRAIMILNENMQKNSEKYKSPVYSFAPGSFKESISLKSNGPFFKGKKFRKDVNDWSLPEFNKIINFINWVEANEDQVVRGDRL
jgi:beta-lactamase class A